MKLLVVAALCALAAARIPNPRWLEEALPETEKDIQEKVFRQGKEYRFVYNGQLLTGIPSSSQQHSGSRFQAIVSLIFKTQETALLKFTHIRMGQLNRQVPNPRVILPFQAYENAPISDELKEKLQAPVQFKWRQGLITDVVFDGIEQPWSANIKRGVLNLLQVNLGRRNLVESSEESTSLLRNELSDQVLTPDMDFFRVTENTLEGECETLYTVVSEPSRFTEKNQRVLNVTKSINFEKCNKRPEIKYNWRFQSFCPTCEPRFSQQDKFLKSSSVFNFNISGDQESFLIESSRAESQYVVVPFSEEGSVVVTYVNQTLVLVASGAIKTEIPQPQSPQESDSDMIYTPDWDIMKEKFFMQGEDQFHQKTPFSEITNKIEFVSSILRKLVTQVRESVDDQAPRHFDVLVKFFRLLKLNEIEKVWKQFYIETPSDFTPEEQKKLQNFVVDAIAFAGTKDNVVFLIQKIKARQIQPFLASLAVKSFINIRVVSKDMIDELFTLAESEVARRNFFLKQSSYLTLGSLINALCRPNEDSLAMEVKLEDSQRFFCPREMKQRFVEKLFTKFRQAEKWEDKVLFLKTISNAGIDLSVFELEKIAKNMDQQSQRLPTFVRIEAVMAMRQLRDIMPRKIQKILLPIFMNRFLAPELRIVAAYQIFQTMPERAVLDQIARRLFNEPSRQVTSFVFTYMHTLANSSIPCEQKLAHDLKLSLRHSRFPEFSFFMGYSKMVHKSMYSDKYNLGLGVNVANVFSNTSYFPRITKATFSPAIGGFWFKHFATFGVVNQGFENMFWKYFGDRGFFFEKPMEEILRRSPRSTRRSPSEELKYTFENLKIRPREYFPQESKAFFFLRFKDQEFGFLPFSLESLPEEFLRMFESGNINVRRIEQFLEQGYQFEFFKGMLLHEMSYKIPTTIGFPLRFRVTVPTVMSLTGQIKAEFEGEEKFQKMTLNFNELKPSFVSTWLNSIEVWNPIVNSGMRVMAKAKAFYPFTGKLQLDLSQSPKELVFSVQPPSRPINVFSLETRPITYTFLWPEKFTTYQEPNEITVMGDDWTRVNKYERSFGEHLFGVKMNLRSFWHRSPLYRQADTPICPLSGPNKFVFTMEPGYEMPSEYIFKLTGDLFEPIKETFKPELRDFQSIDQHFEPLNIQQLREYAPQDPTKHTIRFEVTTKSQGRANPRRFVFDSSAKCDANFKFCKFNTEFERSPIPRFDNQPFKFCFDGETVFPTTPFNFKQLVGKKAVAQFKLNWGSSCSSSSKFVKLNVIGERSQKQVEYERQSPEYRYFSELTESDKALAGPVAQYSQMYKFAQLLQYKFDLQYSDVPVVFQNYTDLFFRYFKSRYFWQTDVARIQVNNPENRIKAYLNIDPVNKMYFNLTVKTPKENVTFKDLPIKFPLTVSPINVRHSTPALSFLDRIRGYTPLSSRPVCEINSQYIRTFDNVRYSVPFTNCWSVLAKDCRSENPRFGVFMQKMNMESELKKVKIITQEHKFYLVPENDQYESVQIQYNGRKYAPEEFEPVREHGHVVARAQKVGEYLQFSLPEAGIKVFFDGYNVNIKLSQLYRSIQCGLCGHFDNEESDEYRLPSNELTDDVRQFFLSYTIKDKKCTVPEMSELCATSDCRQQQHQVPVYCPVCQHLVREAFEATNLKKKDFQNLITRVCSQYSHVKSRCINFFDGKLDTLYGEIKESDSVSEVCSEINACNSMWRQQQDQGQDSEEEQSQERGQGHGRSESQRRKDRNQDRDQEQDSEEGQSQERGQGHGRSESQRRKDRNQDRDQDRDQRQEQDQKERQSQRQQRERQQRRKSGSRHELAFPVRQTKVIEQSHQLCFSQEPVPVCPRHTYATSFKPERRVVYACLNRDDSQAEAMFRRAHNRFEVLDEVKELPASFTHTELIPETCTHLN